MYKTIGRERVIDNPLLKPIIAIVISMALLFSGIGFALANPNNSGSEKTYVQIGADANDEYAPIVYLEDNEIVAMHEAQFSWSVSVNGTQVDNGLAPYAGGISSCFYNLDSKPAMPNLKPGDVVEFYTSTGSVHASIKVLVTDGAYDLNISDNNIESDTELAIVANNTLYAKSTSVNKTISFSNIPMINGKEYSVVKEVLVTNGNVPSNDAERAYSRHKDEFDALQDALWNDDYDTAESIVNNLKDVLSSEGATQLPSKYSTDFSFSDGSTLTHIGAWNMINDTQASELNIAKTTYVPVYTFTFNEDLKATAVDNVITINNIKEDPETPVTNGIAFDFNFKATGIQATGFNDYKEAFAALNNN